MPAQEVTRVSEVFTPSVPAARGFVGRKREMKDLRQKGLNVPGTQVVVWGESGAGKSSLVNKTLEDAGRTAVQTACTPDSTYEQILEAAFAGTGAFYITETATHTDVSLAVSSTLGNDLVGAKVTAGAEYDTGKEVTRQPIARPQLSPQRLLSELGKRQLSWVIEDFHKVDAPVRLAIAHALKVFSDGGARYPLTTVVVLGVSQSLDELVATEINIGLRLIDIPVPPLTHDDLGQILDVGEHLLNLDFSAVRDDLLTTAVGTASIAHALAQACCDERDVEKTASERVVFTADDFEGATDAYARTRSTAIRSRFFKAIKVHRSRRYNNAELIVRALAELPTEGALFADILAVIKRSEPSYPSSNLTAYLTELQTDRRSSLIRKTADNRYRFDEPLQHAFAKAYFGFTTKPPATKGEVKKATVNYTLHATSRAFNQWDWLIARLGSHYVSDAQEQPAGHREDFVLTSDYHEVLESEAPEEAHEEAEALAEAQAEAEALAEARAEAQAEAEALAEARADYDADEYDAH